MDLRKHGNLIIGIVVGVILGLLLGMLLFWQLFPVRWTDAHSYDLAPDGKAEYVTLVAESFKLEKDPARAQELLRAWTEEEKRQAIADAIQKYEREAQSDKVQALNDLAMASGVTLPPAPTPTETPVEVPATGIWDRLRIPCLVFVLVLLALVLIVFGLRAFLGWRATPDRQTPLGQVMPAVSRREGQVREEAQPLGRFFPAYQLGEDAYDESFSIEAPSGEFLGECGMGISETIGIGEPDKVTAFEVWLFDKSDIRTVTKVLMSEHAYHDETLRAKLAPKGEAVLAEPVSSFALETSGLRVRVNVAELGYGERGDLPPRSFFDRLMVEMVATPKPTELDSRLA